VTPDTATLPLASRRAEVLPQLTVDDLISIGVNSVGHRRKLQRMPRRRGKQSRRAAATVAPRETATPADAERRQLTVMFCDLVGSTALSARFDPRNCATRSAPIRTLFQASSPAVTPSFRGRAAPPSQGSPYGRCGVAARNGAEQYAPALRDNDVNSEAWAGAGQIALLSGEAGIGKSRLAAQLAAEVASEPHTRLLYQCSPHHRDSVLHPFVVALGRAARLAAEDPAQTQLDKLEAILAPARIAETDLSLLPCRRSRPAAAIRRSH
jgi:hypothetical protein